jgi:predicted aconitase with swiveling domain
LGKPPLGGSQNHRVFFMLDLKKVDGKKWIFTTLSDCQKMTEIAEIKFDEFTEAETQILGFVKRGMDIPEVARRLRITQDKVRAFVDSDKVQMHLRADALFLLGGRGAAVAVYTLIEVASNKKAQAAARVSAADKLLNYTGLKVDFNGMDKSPAMMTAEELSDRLRKLHEEAATRAKVVPIIEGKVVENKEESLADFLS